jgi:UDP-N-acetylmuramate dehydrogenase
LTPIGLGSNLLVRDGGIRGTVVVLHAALNTLEMRGDVIYAEAGVASPKVARFAAKHGFAGAEFLAGIPGTVGGALAMNAGCYGGETWNHVTGVEVLTRAGIFEQRPPAAYAIGYRSVRRAGGEARDGIFTARGSRFPKAMRMPRACASRSSCAGASRPSRSTCRMRAAYSAIRPGDHAARLIERCGLKGYTIGGARVSRSTRISSSIPRAWRRRPTSRRSSSTCEPSCASARASTWNPRCR